MQRSAFAVSQAAQAAPGAPQLPTAQVVHWLPVQQPDAQLVASQTQAPPTQCCPWAQTAPLPQAHWPATQESARASQVTQAPASRPQFITEGVRQSLPTQHPAAHVCAQPWHTPPAQGEAPQSAHAWPLAPQAAEVSPPWQVLPAQQPVQLDVVHVHALLTHSRPVAQAG